MISFGHQLFRPLQEGKYFAATRGIVAYDYWDELPSDRKQQYNRAAETLISQGIEMERERNGLPKFDPEATTMIPPPRSRP